MARFTASLIDQASLEPAITVNDGCTIMTIIDSSNYAVNDSTNATTVNFTSYRSLTVTRPDLTTYLFSSIGTPDETLATASTGNNEINYNILDTDTDGVWEFQLCTVPDWSAGSYDLNDNVFHNAKFWLSTLNANTSEPGVNTDWTEIQEVNLGSAYCTSEKIALTCIQIDACFERLILDASCTIDKDFCDPHILCKNKTFLEAIELQILFRAIQFSVNRKDWTKVTNDINLMKSICNCSGN